MQHNPKKLSMRIYEACIRVSGDLREVITLSDLKCPHL